MAGRPIAEARVGHVASRLVVGILIGAGAVMYLNRDPGPTRLPEPCVLAIREDFYAYWSADSNGVPGPGSLRYDENGEKAQAYNAHFDDAFAWQE